MSDDRPPEEYEIAMLMAEVKDAEREREFGSMTPSERYMLDPVYHETAHRLVGIFARLRPEDVDFMLGMVFHERMRSL